MPQTNVNIRMDENLKKQFDHLCNELGLTMTTAINIFAKAMVRQQGIPFDVSLNTPNAETLAAISEIEDMIKNKTGKIYNSVDELFEDLDS